MKKIKHFLKCFSFYFRKRWMISKAKRLHYKTGLRMFVCRRNFELFIISPSSLKHYNRMSKASKMPKMKYEDLLKIKIYQTN